MKRPNGRWIFSFPRTACTSSSRRSRPPTRSISIIWGDTVHLTGKGARRLGSVPVGLVISQPTDFSWPRDVAIFRVTSTARRLVRVLVRRGPVELVVSELTVLSLDLTEVDVLDDVARAGVDLDRSARALELHPFDDLHRAGRVDHAVLGLQHFVCRRQRILGLDHASNVGRNWSLPYAALKALMKSWLSFDWCIAVVV